MRIYAIGDLHLPGTQGKTMEVFGETWRNHPDRIAADWDARVAADDLVLIPGDISWAMRLRDAEPDLDWIGRRPGRKVMIKGNHDYWWQSIGKVRAALPPGCAAIQNDAYVDPSGLVAVAGSRMWDIPGLSLGDVFGRPVGTEVISTEPGHDEASSAKIFDREMERLERSLQALPDAECPRIAMVHYPPTNPELEPTAVTELLERHRIDLCVFGHVHNLRPRIRFAGERNRVTYVLASADYVGFRLVELGVESTA